jgi:putative tributyrin esterase
MKSMKILITLLLCFNFYAVSQDTLVIYKDYIPYPDTTLIFFPRDYNEANTYPLVVMLHGWSADFNQWNEIAYLQNYSDDYQFIIACPDGFFDCWYINSPVLSTHQFETFFFNDLIPEISEKYKIDSQNIFITGLSMGGHGAVYLYLKNLNFFKGAASTSGILDLSRFPDRWGIDKILGPFNENENFWYMFSTVSLIPNAAGQKVNLYIDCGTGDFAFETNKLFAEICARNGVEIEFVEQPGNHSPEYWRKSASEHFKFFKRVTRK